MSPCLAVTSLSHDRSPWSSILNKGSSSDGSGYTAFIQINHTDQEGQVKKMVSLRGQIAREKLKKQTNIISELGHHEIPTLSAIWRTKVYKITNIILQGQQHCINKSKHSYDTPSHEKQLWNLPKTVQQKSKPQKSWKQHQCTTETRANRTGRHSGVTTETNLTNFATKNHSIEDEQTTDKSIN